MDKALSIPQSGKFTPTAKHYELVDFLKTIVHQQIINSYLKSDESKPKHTGNNTQRG